MISLASLTIKLSSLQKNRRQIIYELDNVMKHFTQYMHKSYYGNDYDLSREWDSKRTKTLTHGQTYMMNNRNESPTYEASITEFASISYSPGDHCRITTGSYYHDFNKQITYDDPPDEDKVKKLFEWAINMQIQNEEFSIKQNSLATRIMKLL